MILGVAGTHGSGKDTMAAYLMKKGFGHYSHSDVLREDLRSQGIEVTRENLVSYGNKLRAEKGPDILTCRIQAILKKGMDYVITSIRNEAEVKAWQELNDFRLVWVDASEELRFKRFMARHERNSESQKEQTFNDFLAAEKREWENDDPNKQQLKRCKALANETIINDSTLENFHKKIDILLKGG